ncbi:DUF1129 family protein [Psychrobacillus psychrodurans]|uniref:DUF1129 family protein n=1 Tax=Psychrobacillus psychrodurans TaxID=126157 RepID=UPI0008E8CC9A|nr:DUF1129 family protein [Psychrobacillus psychrodurans]MCZ8538835.1 DUF1129 family protein [Psychrobacillus psychrodurans]SFM22975.1 Protein of unknown function [Psychrobacillus psychrodurans]
MKASELIEQNNQKRALLTEGNEKYYTNLLLYIRTKLTLSEQQSEEVLMEMLDHLIEGQQEGKTAKEIFGNDPKGYADEIVSQLPRENKRNSFIFMGEIAVNIIGWFLIMRSIIIPIIGGEASEKVYVISSLLLIILIMIMTAFGVKMIFGLISQSSFDDKATDKKMMFKAGLYGAGGFLIIAIISFFVKEVGPSFTLPWQISFGIGSLLLLVSWLIKKSRI